ncbi:MAG: NADH:ubiquinone reductase (Na(+)-transporting) subunit D [Flavobacteriales bacterium]|nr:NADH:ubiquinone reductase (Na(+)-transporting) subunit D [Flavobacteriales bacterium]
MSIKENLFSSKHKKLIKDPLDDNNPITIQVLGICSALAITVKLEPAIVMSFSVLFVLSVANVVISLIRKMIPSRIRIIVQLVVIATLVILVDQFLKAYLYDVSKQLSVFVGLIITNCIIMGRLEAFGLANGPWKSFLDGIGNSIGYAWVLIVVAFFRELFGTGQLYGYQIIPLDWYVDSTNMAAGGYVNNGMMILPPMALVTVGIIIWIQRSRNKKLIEDK